MKVTKAYLIWNARHEGVRFIKNEVKALEAANQTLHEELGIAVTYSESNGEAIAEARLPNGQVRQEKEVGYLTTTVCFRMTEKLLSKIKVSDLERNNPKAT